VSKAWVDEMSKLGRPRKVSEAQHETLRAIVQANPMCTLAELGEAFAQRTGVTMHAATLTKALKEAGIKRLRGQQSMCTVETVKTKRYGYTQAHRERSPEQGYASSVTDAEWELVSDIFDTRGRGTPPVVSRRQLVDACCYVVRTGCSWRMLPREFGPWHNVYKTFRRWSASGKFEQMHDRLRARWRERESREHSPSAGVLDAQSTRGSPQGGDTGYDAGKKVKGRKRSLVVDTLGLLLAVSVSAASVQDRDAAVDAVARAASKYPAMETMFVDSAYAGQFAHQMHQEHGIRLQVVRHPANKQVGRWQVGDQHELFALSVDASGFTVLPKRWVVERTHAWNERSRRLIMHHDRLVAVSEAWIWLAEARLLMRRLTTTAV